MPINLQIEYPKLIDENVKLRMALYAIRKLITSDDIEAIRDKAIFYDFDNLLTHIEEEIDKVLVL